MIAPTEGGQALWRQGRPVSELGEFGLIARIRERVRRAAAGRVSLARETSGEHETSGAHGASGAPDASGGGLACADIGDDCALLRPPSGWDLLLTCDTLVEGRHFRREWITPRELGARAAEINVSDIAAMGGLPDGALISLGLQPDFPVAAVDEIYEGLLAALGAHGARILGGNVTTAASLFLDVTLAGRVEAGEALCRHRARPGEVVFVTGVPGRAGAALAALAAGEGIWPRVAERVTAAGKRRVTPDELRERMRRYHAVPRARIEIGRYLLKNELASAAIDVSDGLAGDAAHLCEESGVAITLEEIFLPLDGDLRQLGEELGTDPLRWVLGASDDYELLFTVPPERVDQVFAIAGLFDVRVTPVGSVLPGPGGVRLRRKDGSFAEPAGGWDHLRGGA